MPGFTTTSTGIPTTSATLGYQPGAFGGVSARNRANELLLSDLQKMQSGNLGLTNAQKRQMVSNAQTSAGQQIQAQQADLARQAMAAGPAWSGQYAAAQQNLGQQAANAGAQAAVSADQLSAQLAAQQEAYIRSQLDAQKERQRQNAQYVADTSEKAIGDIASNMEKAAGAAAGGA